MHLALLRGINVGGKAKLPMKELAAIFSAAGATSVTTFIQSGNVIFEAAAPEKLVAAVTLEIARIYSYPGRIVLRSASELKAASKANPFANVVKGREIFLHLPNGMARTKLTNAWFDSKLKTVSTARNWNTVGKLVELMS
jgi:uncharacterized protein (DUF1697 family)